MTMPNRSGYSNPSRLRKKGVLKIEEGAELSGVVFTGKQLPEAPYEIEVEARRTSGVDFFCGLTLPVRDAKTCMTFICGGWGGGVVGFSSIDDMDASENETASYQAFKDDQWTAEAFYRLTLSPNFAITPSLQHIINPCIGWVAFLHHGLHCILF